MASVEEATVVPLHGEPYPMAVPKGTPELRMLYFGEPFHIALVSEALQGQTQFPAGTTLAIFDRIDDPHVGLLFVQREVIAAAKKAEMEEAKMQTWVSDLYFNQTIPLYLYYSSTAAE